MAEEEIPQKGKLSPKPYARLLTMMGDQLIKNGKIALIELVKNSYDADADWVKIRFKNFKLDEDQNTLLATDNSFIEIEDNGIGMSFNTIKNTWMNPATPLKHLKKQSGERKSNVKGRIIQGEKGIGRFATFKIGKIVEIFTKAYSKSSSEIYLLSDLSKFDDELIQEKDSDKKDPLFLEQIEFDYEINKEPREISGSKFTFKKQGDSIEHGTLIKISEPTGSWSIDKLEEIRDDIGKIQSPFELESNKDFEIDLLLNEESLISRDNSAYSIDEFFRKAPIIAKNGSYSNEGGITFELNGVETHYDLESLKAYSEFKKRFLNKGDFKRMPECGPFDFEFYVFDRRGKSKVPAKYWLNQDEKKFTKTHRIYLSRDGIRVYPYGDPDDDWLEIDQLRGTGRAGDYLSNDQTMGRVEISQKENPLLKDKTNREGLLEIGNAFEDFKVIIRAILHKLRLEFDKYKLSINQRTVQKIVKEKEVDKTFKELTNHLSEEDDQKGQKILKSLEKNYGIEKDYLIERAEVTEDLAAVGISVETASHDLMMVMEKAKNSMQEIMSELELEDYDKVLLKEKILEVNNKLSVIEEQIKGIQPLFKSSTRRRKSHSIISIIESVKKYFVEDFDVFNIEFIIEEKGPELKVKSYEAVLLQTFINLIDNSIYWLETVDNKNKIIKIVLDGDKKEVLYADSGPGIREDDTDYIFEPFFSTKGEGRGLGLYICRQLLERSDFSIEYASNSKLLQGANFLITF